MSSNWNQVPSAVVLDLIEAANPEFAQYRNKYTVSNAVADTTTEGKNTRVTLTPLEGSGMNGTVDVFYSRVAPTDYIVAIFPQQVGTWPSTLPVFTATSPIADIIAGINGMLNLQLTADDFDATSSSNQWVVAGNKTEGGFYVMVSDSNLMFIPGNAFGMDVKFTS